MTFLKFAAIRVSLLLRASLSGPSSSSSRPPRHPWRVHLLFQFDFSSRSRCLIISFCSSLAHVSLRPCSSLSLRPFRRDFILPSSPLPPSSPRPPPPVWRTSMEGGFLSTRWNRAFISCPLFLPPLFRSGGYAALLSRPPPSGRGGGVVPVSLSKLKTGLPKREPGLRAVEIGSFCYFAGRSLR